VTRRETDKGAKVEEIIRNMNDIGRVPQSCADHFQERRKEMGDKGKKDKGKREQQKKAQLSLKDKRKAKQEKKKK